MASTVDINRLCEVIEDALKVASGKASLSASVTEDSEMRSPAEWDSLAFVAVFIAVNRAFGLEPEDDDAIHFTKVTSIRAHLERLL